MNEVGEPATTSAHRDLPRLAYSVRETAAMLGVSEKSVRRLVVRGLLRPSRALRHLLIPRSEIERLLKVTV
jgi:excisionase family DNA binding protein